MRSGVSAAARPARRDPQRSRRAVMGSGSGIAANSTSPGTRAGGLGPACLVAGALALLAPAGDSQAQSRIDRLFSTPEQRAELDRLREHAGAAEVAAPAPDPPAPEPPPGTEPESTAFPATLNGVVVRGDGHRVAWIDGVETAAGSSTPSGIRVEPERSRDGRPRVRLSLGRTTAVLAPGQSVGADGTVRNGYERRPGAFAAGTTGGGASNRRTPDGESPAAEFGVR